MQPEQQWRIDMSAASRQIEARAVGRQVFDPIDRGG